MKTGHDMPGFHKKSMAMVEDSLAKWRRPGSKPVQSKETDGVVAVSPPPGIRLRPYKAFAADTMRVPMLMLKRGLVKKPEAEIALPYGYLNKITSDGYGFVFSMSFARPHPWGPVVVEIRGEGMSPLVDGILSGTIKSVQIFDPDRHLPTEGGDFNIEADAWEGPCVVKDISVTEKNSPVESATKH